MPGSDLDCEVEIKCCFPTEKYDPKLLRWCPSQGALLALMTLGSSAHRRFKAKDPELSNNESMVIPLA